MSAAMTAGRARVSMVRRVLVWTVVASFGGAAIAGIGVLLGATLDETGWHVLSTTSIVGAFSVAVLCCASIFGRRVQIVGFVGAAVSIATALGLIVMTWATPDQPADAIWKWLWTGAATTAAFMLASLLLLLADRRRLAIRIGLLATLVALLLLLGLIINAIWGNGDGDVYARAVGIVSIVTALGAIVVPVLSLLVREAPDTRPQPWPVESFPVEIAQRLIEEAAHRGVSVDELVAPLLAGTGEVVDPESPTSSERAPLTDR